jgi:predicted dehydrogenase
MMSQKNDLGNQTIQTTVPHPHNGVLKVGVIGCGYWGPKLARNFHELLGVELTMASDLRSERLAEINERYPYVTTTLDYEDLIHSDLDALVIATPVNTHYKLAKESLLAGKHVLVEKPITTTSSEAEELLQLASVRNLTLMVGHTFEYNPAVEAVKEIIQSGELGDIRYLDASRVNLGLLQPDINVLWDLAPHDISIIRFILGMDPYKVCARGAVYVNTYKKLHEVAYMVMFFENGTMANIRMSWLDPVKERKITIVGSKKMLVYDDIADNKVVIYDKGVDVPPYSITEEEFHASYRHGGESVYPLDWEEPLRKECSHFLECIRTGSSPRSNGTVGLKIVKILETAQKSLLNGGEELKIDY